MEKEEPEAELFSFRPEPSAKKSKWMAGGLGIPETLLSREFNFRGKENQYQTARSSSQY